MDERHVKNDVEEKNKLRKKKKKHREHPEVLDDRGPGEAVLPLLPQAASDEQAQGEAQVRQDDSKEKKKKKTKKQRSEALLLKEPGQTCSPDTSSALVPSRAVQSGGPETPPVHPRSSHSTQALAAEDQSRIAVHVAGGDGARGGDASLPLLLASFPSGLPAQLRPPGRAGSVAQQTLAFRLVSAAEADRMQAEGGPEEAPHRVSETPGKIWAPPGPATVLVADTPRVVYRSEPLDREGASGPAAVPGRGANAARVGMKYGVGVGAGASCQLRLGLFSRSKGELHVLSLSHPSVARLEGRIKGLAYSAPRMGDGAPSTGEEGEEEEGGEGIIQAVQDAAAAAAEERRKSLLAQNLLTDTFGSKVQRRMVDNIRRSLAAGSAQTEQALLSSLGSSRPGRQDGGDGAGDEEGGGLPGVRAGPSAAGNPRNVPPHDLAAETPAEAYPLSLLVPEEEWESTDPGPLLTAANAASPWAFLRQATRAGEGAYPQFVVSRLRRLTATGIDADVRATRAKCLMHFTYLFRFLKAHPSLSWGVRSRTGTEGEDGDGLEDEVMPPTAGGGLPSLETIAQHLPAPLATTARLVRTFSDVSSGGVPGTLQYSRPDMKKDLLIETMLVLGLHVDSFDSKLNAKHCASDFRIMPKQLVQYLRELGCTVKRLQFKDSLSGTKRKWEGDKGNKEVEEIYRATLPVPLQFPELRRRRQAKKKV